MRNSPLLFFCFGCCFHQACSPCRYKCLLRWPDYFLLLFILSVAHQRWEREVIVHIFLCCFRPLCYINQLSILKIVRLSLPDTALPGFFNVAFSTQLPCAFVQRTSWSKIAWSACFWYTNPANFNVYLYSCFWPPTEPHIRLHKTHLQFLFQFIAHFNRLYFQFGDCTFPLSIWFCKKIN